MDSKKKRNIFIIIIFVVIVIFLGSREERQTFSEEQQGRADFILDRLLEGYESWEELVEWAIENQIEYEFSVNEGGISGELIEKVNRYGPDGDFVSGERVWTPTGGSKLVLFFDNLTYNKN